MLKHYFISFKVLENIFVSLERNLHAVAKNTEIYTNHVNPISIQVPSIHVVCNSY